MQSSLPTRAGIVLLLDYRRSQWQLAADRWMVVIVALMVDDGRWLWLGAIPQNGEPLFNSDPQNTPLLETNAALASFFFLILERTSNIRSLSETAA